MFRRLHEWEEKCIGAVERRLPPALGSHLRRNQRLFRYLTAGGTSAVVDLGLLYIFTDIFDIHYLISAVIAFLASFAVSFALQKFWTFQDHSVEHVHRQATVYFIVAAVNLLLNTILMYVLVDIVHVWYIFSQILASGLIACESFFISRYIFKGKT